MRNWFDRWRRHRLQRAAHHLRSWLQALQQALDRCRVTLALRRPPDDLGQLLDAVDLPLMRCRSHEGPARRSLRRRDPELARHVRDLTHQAFVVRNLYFRYLVRWATHDELGPYAIQAQREMEDARLALSRALHHLGAELTPAAQRIQALAQHWEAEPPR